MVLGGISLTAHTDFVVITNGNLNTAIYGTFSSTVLYHLPLT